MRKAATGRLGEGVGAGLVQRIFQGFGCTEFSAFVAGAGGAELRHLGGGNPDGGAGVRVASATGCTVADIEAAKPHQCDHAAFTQGGFDNPFEGVHGAADGPGIQPGSAGDFCAQFAFAEQGRARGAAVTGVGQGLAGLRVASGALRGFASGEAAQAVKLDALACVDVGFDAGFQRFEDLTGGGLGDVGRLGNLVEGFGFVHVVTS